MIRYGAKNEMKKSMQGDWFTDEEREAMGIYLAAAFEKISVVDIVELRPERFIGYGVHSLGEADRLGNPNLDFPIGMVYGDRDFLGSEVSDTVIKNSMHFSSGKS